MDPNKPTLGALTQEEAWRRDFEKMGEESLRKQIADGGAVSQEYLRCAHVWILEKEAVKFATEGARFRKVLGWTIVGAFTTIIAAAAFIVVLFSY